MSPARPPLGRSLMTIAFVAATLRDVPRNIRRAVNLLLDRDIASLGSGVRGEDVLLLQTRLHFGCPRREAALSRLVSRRRSREHDAGDRDASEKKLPHGRPLSFVCVHISLPVHCGKNNAGYICTREYAHLPGAEDVSQKFEEKI